MRKPGKHQFVPGIRYLRSMKNNLKFYYTARLNAVVSGVHNFYGAAVFS